MPARHEAMRGDRVAPPVVLTVAGSDSGGGAGIQADLKTFAACGVFGTSAITALTAQNTAGVLGIEAVSPGFVAQQMKAVLDDFSVAVVKTGMLPTPQVVEEVADAIRRHPGLQLVVDPVLVSTSGDNLAGKDVGAAIAKHLFPLATVITPNLSEASSLIGGELVDTLSAMQHAAKALHAQGPKFVLVKGGHLRGSDEIVDVLYDGTAATLIPGPRVVTGNTHGTGCTTASAIAAFLAKGVGPPAAVAAAREYVVAALQSSQGLQLGCGPQRPFDHLLGRELWSRSEGKVDRSELLVYAVTDPGCNETKGRSNEAAVAAAVAGGVSIVQLREKDTDGAAFCGEAAAVLTVTRAAGVKLLINDRVDVALAVAADGVHVGQGDIPAAAVRRLLGPGKVLGVSVKTAAEARQAEADGADYLGAGAMYPTATKDSSTISLETLAEICAAVSIPVVAIGGIKASNAAACIQAGCAGVAVVSAIFAADDPAAAAAEIRAAVHASS